MKPTQQELIQAIDYDPIAGTFHWTHHESVYINVRGKETGTSGPKGHKSIRWKNQVYRAHQIAWVITHGYWCEQVDHREGERGDNRLSNLRAATHHQNMMNRIMAKNNTSGFKGVTLRRYGGYEAVIQVNGKKISLGKFLDPKEAAKAYDEAAVKYFGEFARTNRSLGRFADKEIVE